MKTKKNPSGNGNSPVTQVDLSLWGGRLQEQIIGLDQRMDGLDKRMDGLDQRMDSLERGQATILQVVQSIDQQLREHKDLPARVARLERSVFRG
ncbi:MAG: hypothetical protein Q8P73_05215 [bacterium]|nr:hypothetical protein [bacterium]